MTGLSKQQKFIGVPPEKPSSEVLSEFELTQYSAYLKSKIFSLLKKQIAELKSIGWMQRDLAKRLSMDPGQLSRHLSGEHDLQLETLSDLARGLDCKLDVNLVPLSAVPARLIEVRLVNNELKYSMDLSVINVDQAKVSVSQETSTNRSIVGCGIVVEKAAIDVSDRVGESV